MRPKLPNVNPEGSARRDRGRKAHTVLIASSIGTLGAEARLSCDHRTPPSWREWGRAATGVAGTTSRRLGCPSLWHDWPRCPGSHLPLRRCLQRADLPGPSGKAPQSAPRARGLHCVDSRTAAAGAGRGPRHMASWPQGFPEGCREALDGQPHFQGARQPSPLIRLAGCRLLLLWSIRRSPRFKSLDLYATAVLSRGLRWGGSVPASWRESEKQTPPEIGLRCQLEARTHPRATHPLHQQPRRHLQQASCAPGRGGSRPSRGRAAQS